MIQIGKVLKAHGIKGELKLSIVPDYKDCFGTIKTVFVSNSYYEIESCRIDKWVYVKFKSVDGRTQVDRLHDCFVYANESDLPVLREYEYYYSEIIGSQVYLGDMCLGQLIDIGQYGTADVHTVKTVDDRIVRYPFLKRLIVDIDIAAKRIVFSSDEFDKVCIYE